MPSDTGNSSSTAARQQTLQDILNTIQWEDYNDHSEETHEENSLLDDVHTTQQQESSNQSLRNITSAASSSRRRNGTPFLSQQHQNKRPQSNNTTHTRSAIGTAYTTLTGTISMPSTPAYSMYSYYNDLDDEYEKALNEFDNFDEPTATEDDAMTLNVANEELDDMMMLETEGEYVGEEDDSFEDEMEDMEGFKTIRRGASRGGDDQDLRSDSESMTSQQAPPPPQNDASSEQEANNQRKSSSAASSRRPFRRTGSKKASRKSHRSVLSSKRGSRKRKLYTPQTIGTGTLDTSSTLSDDSVELSKEQLYHLHLDNGELDQFRSSVMNIKQEMEHIDFEEKKKNIQTIQEELQKMNRRKSKRRRKNPKKEQPTQSPSSESTTQKASTEQDESHPSTENQKTTTNEEDSAMSDDSEDLSDTLSNYSTPRKEEDDLLKLKEEHYRTIASAMETEDDPLHDLLKSVQEINVPVDSEDEESDEDERSQLENEEPVEESHATQDERSVASSSVLSRKSKRSTKGSTQKEKELLQQLQREKQEREEKKRKLREEHQRRMEQIRLERQQHEERVRREQEKRLERERQREEQYRKEQEEKQREHAIWIMRREEQLMRDYMFELEQKRLEEEQQKKQLEEKRRKEWEAEQERLRQEELRKAEERRQRLEAEKKERERLARERYLREQEEARQRELERQRLLEQEKRRKREEELLKREEAKKVYFANLDKEHKQYRKERLQTLEKTLRSVFTAHHKATGDRAEGRSLFSRVREWKRSLRAAKSRAIRTPPVDSSPSESPPNISSTNAQEIQLDDDLIEVLSGAVQEQQEEVATVLHPHPLVNLILSVENITSIGKITREDFTKVLSLVLDENSLSSLWGIAQFPSLRHLSVKLNGLKSLAGLKVHRHLLELNVETNQLESLNGIGGCSNLRLLNASHNKLSNLNHITQCKKLSVLKLYRNSLTHLDPISHLDALLELDAGRNKISSLSESTFDHATLLQKLVLYQNQLERMPPTYSNVLLRQLYLNGNSIESVDTKQLFHPLLEYLNLSDNKIEKLSSFSHFVSLKNLNLSFNAVDSLDELVTAFRGCRIDTLKMNDNPVSEKEGYRALLIALIPNLRILDDETVTEEERDEVEFYLTMRDPKKNRLFTQYIQNMSRSDPRELIRQIRDKNTRWYHICRDSQQDDRDSQLDEEELAYKSMCARQNAEYITFNSRYKKKLYIPLNKKTNQKKHEETIRLKSEYYRGWHALAKKHQEEHVNFNMVDQQDVLVHNAKYAEQQAALVIQRTWRSHRSTRVADSVLKIQSVFRGYLCRKEKVPWIIQKFRERHKAAIRIQSIWRGYRVRHVLWKAKQIDPFIDEYLEGLEQVDLDEFNFDATQLDRYELRADLPQERKVSVAPTSNRRRSTLDVVQDGERQPLRNRNSIQSVEDESDRPARRNTTTTTTTVSSSDDEAPVSSVYRRKKFHSTYMKERVSKMPRGVTKSRSKAVSQSGPNRMDILDAVRQQRKGIEAASRGEEEFSSQQSTRRPRVAAAFEADEESLSDEEEVPAPSRTLSPTKHYHDREEDDQVLRESPDGAGDVRSSSTSKKTTQIEHDKETWHFKNKDTASAWEKWAKRRKKLKRAAKKKKEIKDPMERFRKLQKKVGHTTTKSRRSVSGTATGGAPAPVGRTERVFTRRAAPVTSTSLSQQSDIDIESVSSLRSQDFHQATTTARPRASLHQQTYNFPAESSSNRRSTTQKKSTRRR